MHWVGSFFKTDKPLLICIVVISDMIIIGLTEYFFKPYYSCSAAITGTNVKVNPLASMYFTITVEGIETHLISMQKELHKKS